MNGTKGLTRRDFSMGAGLAALWLPRQVLGQGAAIESTSVSADEGRANVALVVTFCQAWGQKDLGKIASLLADDCSFRVNQRSPPIVGKETVTERFKNDFERASFELKILKTVVLGPVVLTRREDIITPLNGNPPRTIRIPAGMFFVDNEMIIEWTDFQLK